MTPVVKYDKNTIEKVKKRQGVYSKLPIEKVTSNLKEYILEIIKASFIEYARKHGCAPQNEMKEWTRFCKILEKKL